MNKLLSLAAFAALLSALPGCMTVYDGDKVFAISAKKFIAGPGIKQAESKIPAGATVLHVMSASGPFGLIQTTYIAGTK